MMSAKTKARQVEMQDNTESDNTGGVVVKVEVKNENVIKLM